MQSFDAEIGDTPKHMMGESLNGQQLWIDQLSGADLTGVGSGALGRAVFVMAQQVATCSEAIDLILLEVVDYLVEMGCPVEGLSLYIREFIDNNRRDIPHVYMSLTNHEHTEFMVLQDLCRLMGVPVDRQDGEAVRAAVTCLLSTEWRMGMRPTLFLMSSMDIDPHRRVWILMELYVFTVLRALELRFGAAPAMIRDVDTDGTDQSADNGLETANDYSPWVSGPEDSEEDVQDEGSFMDDLPDLISVHSTDEPESLMERVQHAEAEMNLAIDRYQQLHQYALVLAQRQFDQRLQEQLQQDRVVTRPRSLGAIAQRWMQEEDNDESSLASLSTSDDSHLLSSAEDNEPMDMAAEIRSTVTCGSL